MEELYSLEGELAAGIWDDIARVCRKRGDIGIERGASRQAYTTTVALRGEGNMMSLWRGERLAEALLNSDERDEALVREAYVLLRKIAPLSRREFGPNDDTTLNLRRLYATSLFTGAASRDDVAKATTILTDVGRTARGRASCTHTDSIQMTLETAREKLTALENVKRRRSTRTQAALETAVLAL